MAITGYEQDQVMVSPTGHPGSNPEQDVSVPINWAYNHHYMAWMTGKHSKMVKLQHPDPENVDAHGAPMKWKVVELPSAKLRKDKNIPTNQLFSEGNGGESRKSFHGYPTGYAQLIDSPDTWMIIPMQIDTRNRDCGVTPKDINNCTNHKVPGPEPKQARYGFEMPKEMSPYSGLLECPCNSRFGGDPSVYGSKTKTKIVSHLYNVMSKRSCKSFQVETNEECFNFVADLGVRIDRNITLSTPNNKVPTGCSVTANSPGNWSAVFNHFSSGQQCSESRTRVGKVTFSIGVVAQVDVNSTTALITLSGPATSWFGVGFNATAMSDIPYVIYVNDQGVHEQLLGTCGSEACHCPGTPLKQSITVLSEKVVNNIRTVVVTRPLKGPLKQYYTFDTDAQSQIPMIAAIGHSQTFEHHREHKIDKIALFDLKQPNCICDMGATGSLCDSNGTRCITFTKNCVPAPSGELLSQRNPTCNSRQYGGGLKCCAHKRILLDVDQPNRPEILRYHMKIRIWFQEYKAIGHNVSHHNLERFYYQTEAWAGEYDVPPAFPVPGKPIIGYPNWPEGKLTPGTSCKGHCPDGDDCKCAHSIVFKWTVSNVRLIYAGGHCHAPSCISMELYRNDTGHEMEILCRQIPVKGKGNVAVDKFDEVGYISLPPCLWGDDKGLQPSVFLPENTPMVSIKYNRNTHVGHFGEMASWQMRGVNF